MKRLFMMKGFPWAKEPGFYIPTSFVSEKYDGFRAWWDGGVSRGLPITAVPWANKNKKDRLLREPVSTGLWSFYGNVEGP
jgi:hypothetical protein